VFTITNDRKKCSKIIAKSGLLKQWLKTAEFMLAYLDCFMLLFLVFIMKIGFVGWFMVFNTTFNNISVISWLPWK
jgi:hypothetical protein